MNFQQAIAQETFLYRVAIVTAVAALKTSCVPRNLQAVESPQSKKRHFEDLISD